MAVVPHSVFEEIARCARLAIHENRALDDIPDQFQQELTIHPGILQIIHRKEYEAFVARMRRYHENRIETYLYWWKNGWTIANIAQRINYPPCILARLLLVNIMNLNKKQVSKYLRTVELIQDERLKKEVAECIELDEINSPRVESIKRNIGTECEFRLQQWLLNLGIEFHTEAELRERGQARTPDALLKIPIAVKDKQGYIRVVRWIDSKASFGLPQKQSPQFIHQERQLNAYVNRFGPGMVIFWSGYVDSMDSFPNVLLHPKLPLSWDVLLPGNEHLTQENFSAGEEVAVDSILQDETKNQSNALYSIDMWPKLSPPCDHMFKKLSTRDHHRNYAQKGMEKVEHKIEYYPKAVKGTIFRQQKITCQLSEPIQFTLAQKQNNRESSSICAWDNHSICSINFSQLEEQEVWNRMESFLKEQKKRIHVNASETITENVHMDSPNEPRLRIKQVPIRMNVASGCKIFYGSAIQSEVIRATQGEPLNSHHGFPQSNLFTVPVAARECIVQMLSDHSISALLCTSWECFVAFHNIVLFTK